MATGDSVITVLVDSFHFDQVHAGCPRIQRPP